MSTDRDMENTNGVDDRETLAALAAVEGLGVLGQDAATVDPEHVYRYEVAAGLVFRALTERPGPRPPADLAERLQAALIPRLEQRGGLSRGGAPTVSGRAPSPDPSPHELSPGGPGRRSQSDEPRPRTGDSGRSEEGGGPAVPGSSVGRPILAVSGWLAAAAAIIFLMLPDDGENPAAANPAEAARELARAQGASVSPWVSEGVSGDVVWSDEANTGYLRIAGLPVNDPDVSQYQLWIFRGTDPADEPHPVDGGVFDVPTTGEVVIPIDAKLEVGSAGLFAVTVERPGGVVVSERERIVAVAARE